MMIEEMYICLCNIWLVCRSSFKDPGYAQCAMLPTYGGTQTHSSYWTYQKKKLGLTKKDSGITTKVTKETILLSWQVGNINVELPDLDKSAPDWAWIEIGVKSFYTSYVFIF